MLHVAPESVICYWTHRTTSWYKLVLHDSLAGPCTLEWQLLLMFFGFFCAKCYRITLPSLGSLYASNKVLTDHVFSFKKTNKLKHTNTSNGAKQLHSLFESLRVTMVTCNKSTTWLCQRPEGVCATALWSKAALGLWTKHLKVAKISKSVSTSIYQS